jgi:PAS domain-containing protein
MGWLKRVIKNKIIWLKIDLPAFIAFIFFAGLIFLYLIPGFEKVIIERKRAMLEDISSSVYSLLVHFHSMESDGQLTQKEAQDLARSAIGHIRYGPDLKDYFWITDMHPVMIEHPYRSDLNGKDLSDFRDPNGKLVFVEFVKAVSASGKSFVDYMWQWNDDSTRVEKKLSYIRLFKPWEWIIGTGIYIEDVRSEIRRIETRALIISGIIAVVIILLLSEITRQSHRIEQKRKTAEDDLIRSKELYRTLAEAATEGVLIWSTFGIHANKTLLSLINYTEEEIKDKNLNDLLFPLDIDIPAGFDIFYESLQYSLYGECELKNREGTTIKAHSDFSRMIIDEKKAIMVVIRPVVNTSHDIVFSPSSEIIDSISTGFFRITFGRRNRFLLASRPALKMLGYNSLDELSVVNIESLFASDDQFMMLKRNLALKRPVLNMVVELKKRTGILFKAVICVVVEDRYYPEIWCEGTIEYLGLTETSITDSLPDPWKSVSSLISSASNIPELRNIFLTMKENAVVMTQFRVDPLTVTSYISSVSDRLCEKVLDICISESGIPPCRFAFIQTGSAGRMEQTLLTDQDNGIIFEDCEEELSGKAEKYFIQLGKKVNEMLNTLGFNLCKGGNMAGNILWCKPLRIWKGYFSEWIKIPEKGNLLEISIFFDFRHCYGDPALTDSLREYITNDLIANDIFFHHMAAAWKEFNPSHDILRRESVDTKRILMSLTGLVRLYSLKYGIRANSTSGRLAGLYEGKCFDLPVIRDLLNAMKDLMQIRLSVQVSQITAGQEPDNNLFCASAGPDDLYRISRAIKSINDLMLKAGSEFYVNTI